MPIQILPRTPSWQEQIATGLGTGLQALASMKFKQLAQQQQVEKMAPFFEKMGIPKEAAYLPPQVQAQLFKETAEQQGNEELKRLLGIPTPSVPGVSEEMAPGIIQPRQKILEELGGEELARVMAIMPERRRKALKPLFDVKLGEEKLGNQRAFDYEKRMKPIVDNSIRFLTAAQELKDFAKTNPHLFNPAERFKPSLSSERQRRDSLINNLILLGISMEGSIGRGSNLMIQLKKAAKPSASMNVKDLLSVIEDQEKIFGAPIQEFNDYIKMSRGRKPPADFLSQLAQRSIERYKKADVASVKPLSEAAKETIPTTGNVIGITRGVPLSGQKGQKGDKLRNKRTGEVEFIHNGMEWEPV